MRFRWCSSPTEADESYVASKRLVLRRRPLSNRRSDFRRSAVSSAWHGVDHIVNRPELLGMCQQQMRQGQCIGLAESAQRRLLNAFEVDHVSEPQDAADHLAGGKAEHVGEQRIQECVSRRIERSKVPGSGENSA